MDLVRDRVDQGFHTHLDITVDRLRACRMIFFKFNAGIVKQSAADRLHQVNASLLHVGCGVGTLDDRLADAFARICGVDVSKKAIETAKEQHPEFEYLMEGNRFPYPSAILDMVTPTNVLHHIDPEASH